MILAYYKRMRGTEERSASRTTIRALESLVRIAQVGVRKEEDHFKLVCVVRDKEKKGAGVLIAGF